MVGGPADVALNVGRIWVFGAVGALPRSFVVVGDDVLGGLVSDDEELPALPVASARRLGSGLDQTVDRLVRHRLVGEVSYSPLGIEGVEELDVFGHGGSPR